MQADLLELLIEAYYQPPARKRDTLTRVNILLEKLRHFYRLGYDLGLYTSFRYQDFAELYPVKSSFAISQGAQRNRLDDRRMAQKPRKIKIFFGA